MNLEKIFPVDFKTKEEVSGILRDHWVVITGEYSVNNDGSIDVFGDLRFVDFASFLTNFPLRFNSISGSFDCTSLKRLSTLKDGPKHVGGTFNCAYTNIKSFEYAPQRAAKLIFDNTITSLCTGGVNCHFDQVEMLVRNSDPVYGLPVLILHHIAYLQLILKYQNYFDVWKDGLFHQEGFESLIEEIKEGLK
jgi:hypothetical protein